jgi:hypothetical protein
VSELREEASGVRLERVRNEREEREEHERSDPEADQDPKERSKLPGTRVVL